ncbi:DUF1178 family protein [Robbsia sp. Bb-Pol-6]|uniref:DUF1178 family protein n=1 Tax=Robbsia betulipollinis TaxID=2981849 RepID=A0ABT3ZML4_9BURK|nr:DUF1178 family protein [Robbsia betulipollinis]MCY0387760.1 DUF1178 family protein [Robbsia betulipollinis]
MKVFDLRCAHDHRFEGWFASSAAFDDQLARDLIACPVCGDTRIARLPSVPHLNLGTARTRGPASPPAVTVPQQAATVPRLQAQWLGMVREMVRQTEDVGQAFAEEARRIHYQEAPARAIRGVTSPREAAELADEGIDIVALPMPVAAKGSLQ